MVHGSLVETVYAYADTMFDPEGTRTIDDSEWCTSRSPMEYME
ncbi:hypothetical protein [Cohnella faecalis]|nr:hypothetical protein [Cohnella faecalis]